LLRYPRPFVIIWAVLVATVAAGCGSSSATPTATPLTDPNAILSGSLTAIVTATTVHVEGTLGGTVNATAVAALIGGGGLGLSGTIKIDGATIIGDMDLRVQAVHMTATFPSLFATKVDLILVDGYAYTRVNTFDSKYTRTKTQTSLLMPSAAPDASLNLVDLITRLRSQLGVVSSTLLGRETIASRDAYHLRVTVPGELLDQAAGAALGGAAGRASFDLAPVDYWVYVDGLAPAKLKLAATSTSLGDLNLMLIMTEYGQPVSINAPPPSDVTGG
jgi:hypothetical protein